jgi:Bacterial capsule synthesis protein PGA_cap
MKKSFFILMIPLLLISCSPPRVATVLWPDDPQLNALLPPLPEGCIPSAEDGEEPVLRLVLRSEASVSENTGIMLEKVYRIPLLPLHDTRSSVGRQEIAVEKLPLITLTDWEYPGRGALVEGLSPSDPDYPLVSYLSLNAIWREDATEKERAVLGRWLDALEERIPEPPKKLETLWIAAVGDIMLQRGVEDILIGRTDGVERIFSDLLPRMTAWDLLLGNLEGAVTRRTVTVPKSFNFRFRPESLAPLKAAGFDYLSLTNNHCYDYGEAGFLDTLKYFSQYGMATSGAGTSPDEAALPSRFTIKGTKLRVLSMGSYPQEMNGFNGLAQASVSDKRAGILWYDDKALEALEAYSSEPGIDIVMVHGGHEWQRSTSAEQRNVYRSLVDSGAEIVFGSHPHVLQGAELYGDGIIYYSLGNFVFNGMESMPYAQDSMIAAVGSIDGRLLYREHLPVDIDGRYLSQATGGRILSDFTGLSRRIPSP